MDTFKLGISSLKFYINGCFCQTEPWQIVAVTTSTVLASIWFWSFLFQDESIDVRTKRFVFKLIKKIPMVSRKLNSEMDKMSNTFALEVFERNKSMPYIVKLPEKGMASEDILNMVHKYLDLGKFDWKRGYVSGAVYHDDQELVDLIMKVYGLTSYSNPLHTDLFPGVCKMEAEVVRMCANLFHGSSQACGTMTTGGTESIMMACKAYRDYCYKEHGIRKAELILPTTAHPAFHKAALYFSMKTTQIQVDPCTFTVNIKQMERAISRNTVMLVGSAPNFPYGTMDNIEAIAALGRKYNIPVHVDCCLGGFLAVFMPQAGFSFPPFDFLVPGVTSISADTHKYGFSPKGSSVILYSDLKYRHQQYCVTTDWPGGVYGSPTINGSRAGGIIAASWATLMRFGFQGYLEATKKIIDTTRYIEKELRLLDSIFIFGTPVTSVIAIGSNKFHIYRLMDALNQKGWNLNALQFPPGMHICVTHIHTKEGVAERFIEDIKYALKDIMKEPDLKVEGKMALYGMTQKMPDRSVIGDVIRLYLDSNYITPEKENSHDAPNGYKHA